MALEVHENGPMAADGRTFFFYKGILVGVFRMLLREEAVLKGHEAKGRFFFFPSLSCTSFSSAFWERMALGIHWA